MMADHHTVVSPNIEYRVPGAGTGREASVTISEKVDGARHETSVTVHETSAWVPACYVTPKRGAPKVRQGHWRRLAGQPNIEERRIITKAAIDYMQRNEIGGE